MKRNLVTAKELAVIRGQIGRRPRGNISVGGRCAYGYPTVIITSPVIESVIFPTTYWLSCPDLVKKVSRLEDKGLINQLKSRLADDDDWRKKLELSTKAQITHRRMIDNNYNNEPWRGIAGVADMIIIKCLHAHLADYLMNGINPIGGEVAKIVAELDDICVKRRLKC